MNESDDVRMRLLNEGWELVSQKGSHCTFRHPERAMIVTVPHPRKELGKGLRRAIYRQAGWKWPPR